MKPRYLRLLRSWNRCHRLEDVDKIPKLTHTTRPRWPLLEQSLALVPVPRLEVQEGAQGRLE